MKGELLPLSREFSALREMVNDLFDDFYERRHLIPPTGETAEETWTPSVDIRETEGEIICLVALPGVAKDGTHLEVKDSTLLIKGERKVSEKETGWLRREMPVGAFFRAIELPADVDPQKVSASLMNGVLEVHVSKVPTAKAREVPIE